MIVSTLQIQTKPANLWNFNFVENYILYQMHMFLECSVCVLLKLKFQVELHITSFLHFIFLIHTACQYVACSWNILRESQWQDASVGIQKLKFNYWQSLLQEVSSHWRKAYISQNIVFFQFYKFCVKQFFFFVWMLMGCY